MTQRPDVDDFKLDDKEEGQKPMSGMIYLMLRTGLFHASPEPRP